MDAQCLAAECHHALLVTAKMYDIRTVCTYVYYVVQCCVCWTKSVHVDNTFANNLKGVSTHQLVERPALATTLIQVFDRGRGAAGGPSVDCQQCCQSRQALPSPGRPCHVTERFAAALCPPDGRPG